MPTYTWIAFGIFTVGLVVGAIWVAINALRAWRLARPSLRRMTASADDLTARGTRLEQRISALEPKLAALQTDVGRLSASLASAGVLVGAVSEAKTALDRLRLFIP